MKKILVTGGAGFIGSNFLKMMVQKYPGYQFVNVDALTYSGNLNNLKDVEGKPNYKFFHAKIDDRELMERLIDENTVVVNFAAESHVDRSISAGDRFLKSNTEGTFIILEAARKKKALLFVQISTDEVYGSLTFDQPSSKEGDSFYPSSPYSASKAAAEMFCLSNVKTHKQPIIITRSSNNFGPYQFPEKIIPLFITNLIQGKRVPVYGTGKNIRDWIFVLDNCEALDFVIHKGNVGEIYNIGGGNEINNMDLTRAILNGTGLGGEMIEYVADRPGHDLRYSLDSSKIKSLGWQPRFKFEEALLQTINWYKDNPQWWMPLKKKMKGIILAGGAGSRLYPLSLVMSKQLQSIYDKPVIYYPLTTLIEMGINDICIISTPKDIPKFRDLLGDGKRFGLHIIYKEQPRPEGIAQAFIIAEEFIGKDNVALILGDNVFYGSDTFAKAAEEFKEGAMIFGYQVKDPWRFGVVEFDELGNPLSIVEKPKEPKSNYAIPGIYLYDGGIVDVAKNLQPSPRGELEITDVNKRYLQKNNLKVMKLDRGIAWLDVGTSSSLQEASIFIEKIESRQGIKVGCPEEAALRKEFITARELEETIQSTPDCEYRNYLISIAKEKRTKQNNTLF
ncbi:dTDP-glucose 4,6-dehydratase [Candidatus Pacearchaeota archaeon]|nr:dTDP-glucose 4,6-dehydratase [Candidatus Pacearchaeota archaeon]